jgi:hypothetical protein
MKRWCLVLAAALLAIPVPAQVSPEAEREAIEKVVRAAYVDGVHAKPSARAPRPR